MKEWLQFTSAICTGVLAIAALATLMQFQFAGMRAEMRAGFDTIRMQMRDEHAAMRDEHADIRMEMRGEHAAMRAQLDSVDRRTARIEGHLFGIEITPDPQTTE